MYRFHFNIYYFDNVEIILGRKAFLSLLIGILHIVCQLCKSTKKIFFRVGHSDYEFDMNKSIKYLTINVIIYEGDNIVWLLKKIINTQKTNLARDSRSKL